MLNLQEIIDIAEDYCQQRGGRIRSRQIYGLAEAITGKVNEQLDFIDKRLKLIEHKYKKCGDGIDNPKCGLHKIKNKGKRHNGQTRLEAIEDQE